jgi:hypothetical protein
LLSGSLPTDVVKTAELLRAHGAGDGHAASNESALLGCRRRMLHEMRRSSTARDAVRDDALGTEDSEITRSARLSCLNRSSALEAGRWEQHGARRP